MPDNHIPYATAPMIHAVFKAIKAVPCPPEQELIEFDDLADFGNARIEAFWEALDASGYDDPDPATSFEIAETRMLLFAEYYPTVLDSDELPALLADVVATTRVLRSTKTERLVFDGRSLRRGKLGLALVPILNPCTPPAPESHVLEGSSLEPQ